MDPVETPSPAPEAATRKRSPWIGPGLLAAAVIALPLAASFAQTEPVPNDGRDDHAALQSQIDRLSASGGGTLQLGPGTYDVSKSLFLRSGVHIRGSGPNTIITNRQFNQQDDWLGTVIFAGSLAPGSFDEHEGMGYVGHPLRRLAPTRIELTGCSAGDVDLRPGTVVWISSEEHDRNPANGRRRHEWKLPVYGEMNVAREVSGCTVTLADPVNIPEDQQLRVHWSDGSLTVPSGLGSPNDAIRDAGLHDLQLDSFASAGLTASGCYKCSFTNLHMGNSFRLVGVQGMRFGLFQNITGTFTVKGIEFAKYATDNVVDGVSGEYRNNGWDVRPAIRFGEYPRNNIVRNVELRVGSSYRRGPPIVSFGGSADNLIENVKIVADEQPGGRGRRIFYGRPAKEVRGGGGLLPPGTTVRNVNLCLNEVCEPFEQ